MQFPSYVTLQAGVARVPRVGQGAARRRRDAGRVPPPQLAGGRATSAETLAFLRSPRRDLRHGRRAPHGAPRTSSRRSSARPPPTRPTCACTAATPPPGTTAAGAPPSASTTSTRPTSSPSGRSRCAQLSSLSERTYRDVQQQRPQRRRRRRADRPGADERADAARASSRGRRRAGHGFTTISPNVKHAEDHADRRQDQVDPRVERREAALPQGPVDLALALVAVQMQATPRTANPAPTISYGQAVLCEMRRHDPPGGQADGERREAGAPPRQVGALVRKARPPCRVAGLVEGAPSGWALAALDLRHGR